MHITVTIHTSAAQIRANKMSVQAQLNQQVIDIQAMLKNRIYQLEQNLRLHLNQDYLEELDTKPYSEAELRVINAVIDELKFNLDFVSGYL